MSIDLASPGDYEADIKAALFPFRAPPVGALAYVGASLTAQNATGSYINVPLNSELYDDVSVHDTVTSNHRMTVPSGYTKARIIGGVRIDDLTANTQINARIARYNSGVALQSMTGMPERSALANVSAGAAFSLVSARMTVSAGDFFILQILTTGDTSITISADRTFLALELWP